MKFPRFTREENRRCKLSDSDIAKIKELHEQGFTLKEIAEQFLVSTPAIRYWVISEEEREKYKKNGNKYAKKGVYDRKAVLRKMELHPEISKYWSEKNRKNAKYSYKSRKMNGQIRMFNLKKERGE